MYKMIISLLFLFKSLIFAQTISFESKHHKYLYGNDLEYFLQKKILLNFQELGALKKLYDFDFFYIPSCDLDIGEDDIKTGKKSITKPNKAFFQSYIACIDRLIEARKDQISDLISINSDDDGVFVSINSTEEKEYICSRSKYEAQLQEILKMEYGEDLFNNQLETYFANEDQLYEFYKSTTGTLTTHKNIYHKLRKITRWEYSEFLGQGLIKHLLRKFVGPEEILRKLNYFGENSIFGKEIKTADNYAYYVKYYFLDRNFDSSAELEDTRKRILEIIFMNEYLLRE